jgi:hypothetical protein
VADKTRGQTERFPVFAKIAYRIHRRNHEPQPPPLTLPHTSSPENTGADPDVSLNGLDRPHHFSDSPRQGRYRRPMGPLGARSPRRMKLAAAISLHF